MAAEDSTLSTRPADATVSHENIGSTAVPSGLRNLFLDRLKALLSQERGVLDELTEDAPESGRRRELFRRLFGDARALRGDGLAFGLQRVSDIGSAVETLVAEMLSAEEGKRAHRARAASNDALAALRSALTDLDAEVERAESKAPAPSDPPACLPRLNGARESLLDPPNG